METGQFKIKELAMEIDGKLMESRRIYTRLDNGNLVVGISFYGGETEFILQPSRELYQDGGEIKNWYYLPVDELKYFNSISNNRTSTTAEIVLSDFSNLLDEFRNIIDKELHQDWHKYAKEQLAKIGRISVGEKYCTLVSKAMEVETEVYEARSEVGLKFNIKDNSLKIKLCDSDIIYFDEKQFHGCLEAVQRKWSFEYSHENCNVFKCYLRDLALTETDLRRVLNCLADIILYRRGKKRRDPEIDAFIMGAEIKEKFAKLAEEEARERREEIIDSGKTKINLAILEENEKVMSISNKSIHVMLMMNTLARTTRGINHSNIEVIGTKVIEPLYKLGQTKENKVILQTLEDYENFYREHLLKMADNMNNQTKKLETF